MSALAMSSARGKNQGPALCLHISRALVLSTHRAKPVSETERSGVERALRTLHPQSPHGPSQAPARPVSQGNPHKPAKQSPPRAQRSAGPPPPRYLLPAGKDGQSMKNDLLTIGGFTIHGYGLMIGIGIIAAYWAADYRSKRYHLDPDHLFWILIWGVGCGLLGAKLLYYITIWREILADPRKLLDIAGGFVVYGGIIGGIAAGYVYCRVRKIDFLRYLDLVVPSVALAQGFGRIGCFLAGCCYGVACDGPFSVTFTNSDYAPNGVALFPSQLVSSGLDFLHFFLLCFLARRNDRPGRIGAFYLLFYSIGRFCIEFFRGDLERGQVGGLSTSQFISLFTAAAGLVFLILLSRKKEPGQPASEGEK